MVSDSKATTSGGVAGCKIEVQCKGGVRADSVSSLIVAARERCGLLGVEVGIREHDAFLGHDMKGPAGTGRGGVSMASGREGQGARKGIGVKVHRLPSPPCFVENLLMYFGFLSR